MNNVPINVRVYLDVPFKDKNKAKEYGCKWDSDNKKWYCIDSDKGKSNITKCVEHWGSKAYKMINSQKILLKNIPNDNRGYTS